MSRSSLWRLLHLLSVASTCAQLGPYTGGRPRFSFGNSARDVDYVYRPLGGRGTNPFAGVLPGLACLVGSSALLWWNEGRAVRMEKMLRDRLKLLKTTSSPTHIISCPYDNHDGVVVAKARGSQLVM